MDEGKKVQTDWLHGFLMDPYAIRPATVAFLDPRQDLHKSIMNFTGDSGPFIRHRCAGFLHVQSVEGLILVQRFLDLRRRADSGADQLPHEFRAGSSDDGHTHSMKILEKLPDLRISRHIDNEVDTFHREQMLIVAGHRNL